MKKLLMCTALVAAGPAAAMTPDELWSTIKNAPAGVSITHGSVDKTNTSMTVRDVIVEKKHDDKTIKINVPEMVMTAQGDEVITTVPQGASMSDEDGRTASMSADNLRIVTSGDVNAASSVGSADQVRVTINGTGDNPGAGEIVMDGVESHKEWTRDASGKLSSFKVNGTTKSMSVIGEDGPANERISMKAQAANLSFGGGMTGDFEAIMAAKHAMKDGRGPDEAARQAISGAAGDFIVSADSYLVDVANGVNKSHYEGEAFEVSSNLAGGVVTYKGKSAASTAHEENEMLPFPLTYKVASSEGALTFPLTVAGKAEMRFNVAGVELDDSTWANLDKNASLPRDPMSFNLSAGADIKPNEDPADGEEPFDITSFNLADLTVKGAGLVVQASGEGQMDESTGEPSHGKALVKIAGAEKILDALVKGGVQEAKVAAARTMLNAYFQPSPDGESKQLSIEFDKDGMSINGMRF